MILQVKDLSVSYWSREGYVDALRHASFTVFEGEILGVVGETGSGKSTIAYSVLNLLPFDSERAGEIFFKNENILSQPEKQMQKIRGSQIGLVAQEPASMFNPVLSIKYQFQEVLKEKGKIKNKSQGLDIILDSFKKVKLPEPMRILRSYPHQLSGGQLQRVALAIAISLKPTLLIADEPTSALDVTIESQIVNLLKELKESLNLTVLFITHNLDLVKVLCDRVVVLYQGRIKEVRSKDELFSAPQDDYTKNLLKAFHDLGD
ncbi:MAG: ABC transporter ATP-binding protein [Candidatus Omnitrophota bacterium]|nr:MAG: ABC transporter ATP-binding protein [Candidatus Omnitrophota bacterium]